MSNEKNPLYSRLDAIEAKLKNIELANRVIPWYDPWELVKHDKGKQELVWRYNDVYTRDKSLLFNMVPHQLDRRTFYKRLESEDYVGWMHMNGIQPVMINIIGPSNYMVSTDGNLLSKEKLTVRSQSMHHSFVNLVSDGERNNLNLAVLVWQAFVNTSEAMESIYFIDGDKGNCSLRNLGHKSFEAV